jgi:hypothetical protein
VCSDKKSYILFSAEVELRIMILRNLPGEETDYLISHWLDTSTHCKMNGFIIRFSFNIVTSNKRTKPKQQVQYHGTHRSVEQVAGNQIQKIAQ